MERYMNVWKRLQSANGILAHACCNLATPPAPVRPAAVSPLSGSAGDQGDPMKTPTGQRSTSEQVETNWENAGE
jgi:hypothetical protein